MLAVLLTGLALGAWAVLVVHTHDVPAVRNRSGCNIEDAVDDCDATSIGMVPIEDGGSESGLQTKEG